MKIYYDVSGSNAQPAAAQVSLEGHPAKGQGGLEGRPLPPELGGEEEAAPPVCSPYFGSQIRSTGHSRLLATRS